MRLTVFADFKLPDANAMRALNEVDADCVVLGLNDELDPIGKLRWQGGISQTPEARLAQVTEDLRNQGRRVIWMTWMRPSIQYSTNVFSTIVRALDKGGQPDSLLFDVERCWRIPHRPAQEFDRISDQIIEQHWRHLTLPIGITSFALKPREVTYLAEHANYCIPQAYSIWSDNQAWTKLPSVVPGALQTSAMKSWKQDGLEIIMGLPLYSLARPATTFSKKMTSEEAFKIQVDTCRSLGIEEVALWSLKHVTPENFKASARVRKFQQFVKQTIKGEIHE